MKDQLAAGAGISFAQAPGSTLNIAVALAGPKQAEKGEKVSKLTEAQKQQLNDYPAIPSCPECGQELHKYFCERCDQFYNHGHLITCSRMKSDAPWTDNHLGHESY